MKDLYLSKGKHVAICSVDYARRLLKAGEFDVIEGRSNNGIFHTSDIESRNARYEIYRSVSGGLEFVVTQNRVCVTKDVLDLMEEVKKFIEEVKKNPWEAFGRFQVRPNVGAYARQDKKRFADILVDGKERGFLYKLTTYGSHGSVSQVGIDMEKFYQFDWLRVDDMNALAEMFVWGKKYIDENKNWINRG